MANYEHILYEKQRGGVLITLNAPERMNSINPDMENELHEALDEADTDPDVRAIVLTGAGRAFSSGYQMGRADNSRSSTVWPYGLPEGTSIAEQLDATRRRDRIGMEKFMHLWELSTPVIAAVNGWAVGGGSWYAVACHMTIASEDAVFAQPEVRHISNTSFFWTLAAGYKHALRYSLTGDHIEAAEALRIGMVNKVVSPDDLLDECFNIVERIAKISPETIKVNLFVTTQGLEMMGLRNALSLGAEFSSIVHVSQREDFKRHLNEAQSTGGVRAFLQERDGPFQPEPFGPRSKPRK